MERSFAKEVEHMRKGDGEYFVGEGILAFIMAGALSSCPFAA